MTAAAISGSRILTVRQPWAWLIAAGIKDIENRRWTCSYRGPLLIHASASAPTPDYLAWASRFAAERGAHVDQRALLYGGIIAVVELIDCVTRSDSPWFEGPIGLVVRDARPLPTIPWKGALKLQLPDDALAQEIQRLIF